MHKMESTEFWQGNQLEKAINSTVSPPKFLLLEGRPHRQFQSSGECLFVLCLACFIVAHFFGMV